MDPSGVPPRSPAHYCFGCGSENRDGLRMRFEVGEGRAVAEYTIEGSYQGYPGLAHGGIVATLLDEAMGWAAYSMGEFAMTAKMTIRYRRPVPLGETLTVLGEVTRARGVALEVRGEVRDAAGRLLADAEGLFTRARGRRAEQLRRAYERSR